jgi:arylsulfatase A-like enzyme
VPPRVGPFDNWPTSIGFEYFYGFLAGEASQYEPNLVRNTEIVLPPRTPEQGYHLSVEAAALGEGFEQSRRREPDQARAASRPSATISAVPAMSNVGAPSC